MKIKNLIVGFFSIYLVCTLVYAQGINLRTEDTIAWKDSLIHSSTLNPWETIEYKLTKPSWEIIKLFWKSLENRKVQVVLSWYHTKKTGIYNIEWRDEEWNSSNSKFTVYPSNCSPVKSTINSSQDSVATNLGTLEVIVKLKDTYWNPIVNQRVKLLSSRFEDKFEDEISSNEDWEAHFFIKSNKNWISTFTAINLTENKTINQRVKIVFFKSEAETAMWWNPYSASLIKNWWLLDKYKDTFWKIDSYKIETSKEFIIGSDENYMEIEAIDSEWNRVKNYQWTILIEVPNDPNVILPWDWLYTFTKKDQWIKKFSLAQTFNKQWNITINVYDFEDWKINEQINWSKILDVKIEQGQTPKPQKGEIIKIISPSNWSKLWSNQINIVWTALPFTDLKVFINEQKKWDAETWEDWWFNITIKWLSDWKNTIYVSEKEWERKSSEEVEIFIDTTPPTIDKIEIFPESAITIEDSFNISIYSEKNLWSVKILIDWSIETLNEKKWEPWLYIANAVAPSYSWEYPVDVMLVDLFWNKETYKEKTMLIVEEKTLTPPEKMQEINVTPWANKVKIQWSAPNSQSKIINYRIYLWLNSGEMEYFWKSSVNDITIENLLAEKKYYISISATDDQWLESEKSDPIEVQTLEKTHDSPIWVITDDKLSAIVGDSRVTLRWKALWNQVSNYKIMYWIDKTNLEEIINTNSDNTIYYIDDLINKVPYYFQIVWTDSLWQEVTRRSNMILTIPNWPGIVRAWWYIDRSQYETKLIEIISHKWSALKTWSEIWFILALCLIVSNWTYRAIFRSNSY